METSNQKDDRRLFFLRPMWIGTGCMISGGVGATYGFLAVLRYARHGDIQPLLFGHSSMAFSTAIIVTIFGLAIFWDGYLTRERSVFRPPSTTFTAHQIVQIVLAVISSLTLVVVALIGALK